MNYTLGSQSTISVGYVVAATYFPLVTDTDWHSGFPTSVLPTYNVGSSLSEDAIFLLNNVTYNLICSFFPTPYVIFVLNTGLMLIL